MFVLPDLLLQTNHVAGIWDQFRLDQGLFLDLLLVPMVLLGLVGPDCAHIVVSLFSFIVQRNFLCRLVFLKFSGFLTAILPSFATGFGKDDCSPLF